MVSFERTPERVAGGASDNYRAPESRDTRPIPHPSATENFSESEALLRWAASSVCTSGVSVTVSPLPLIPFVWVWVRLELECIQCGAWPFPPWQRQGFLFWADLTV